MLLEGTGIHVELPRGLGGSRATRAGPSRARARR